jgi:hypothetical protein
LDFGFFFLKFINIATPPPPLKENPLSGLSKICTESNVLSLFR